MARSVADILREMRANPSGIRFTEAMKVAEHYFGPPRQSGSHRVFRMPWAGDPRIDLQQGKSGQAKPYQVRQLLQAVDRLNLPHARQGKEKGHA